MTTPELRKSLQENLFGIVMAVAALIVVAKAVVAGLQMHENFALMGNDDIMRLTVVRDLIAGQSWFDTTQYRMVPPEGLSLHWSRYVDAGIAAVIVPLSWVFGMDTAEQLGATVWPTLIMLAALCVVGFGTRRVFGTGAAAVAMICLVVWPLTADVHMSAGNLDHHNVQLLLLFVVVFAMIWPVRSLLSGAIGGAAAALSLAVGLESLLFIVVAGLVLVVQSARGLPDARRHLGGFCASLGLGSVMFWLGQAPPETRLIAVCDQLGTPILSLIWVAVFASLAPLALGARAVGWVGFGITVVLTALGLGMIWPLLGTCFDGPYGNLPLELRDYISASIVEAKPAIAYAREFPTPAIIFTLPVVAALVLGIVQLTKAKDTPMAGPLGILLVFCAVGLAVIFYQMRTVIMVASVIPMIAGVVVARMVYDYLETRDAARGLGAILAAVCFVTPMVVAQTVQPFLPQASGLSSTSQCRTYAGLQSLNAVPPAVILAHGNFGGPLIWATHHAALGAPYHRSAASLTNGTLVFAMEEAALRAHVVQTGADYVLLCANTTYQSAFLTDVAAGGASQWLQSVPISGAGQMLLAVQPE